MFVDLLKFDVVLLMIFCDIKDLDYIIIDVYLLKKYIDYFNNYNIEFVIVNEENKK